MLITFSPFLARVLIIPREVKEVRNEKTFEKLEEAIRNGQWDKVPPAWITPNTPFNGWFDIMFQDYLSGPSLKPFRIYNGHHRLDKAIEHGLPFRAYVRYTPGNPTMPKEEILSPNHRD